jgi:hypothetical protein
VFCREKLIFLPFLDLGDWVGIRFVANNMAGSFGYDADQHR